jgi:hydroxymethylpyrimidine pyrophosphatase-like HAD family hydrolase
MPCSKADLLLYCDLDGTLIPDGSASESAATRPLFGRLADQQGACLADVTGRDPGLAD